MPTMTAEEMVAYYKRLVAANEKLLAELKQHLALAEKLRASGEKPVWR